METYDLIMIGGGPAGYLAAERAAAGGLKTLLYEERALGGVCLNEGCIPSKALLHSAKVFEYASAGEKYGVTARDVKLDHAAVMARKNKVVRQLVAGIDASMKKLGVAVRPERAEITGRDGPLFTVRSASGEAAGRQLLIATGSVPILPPIPGLDKALATGFAATSREILELETLPQSMAVIGGGVVGLEMASYYCRAGVKVTVIEMLDKIAGPIDEEISKLLLAGCKKAGIDFKLSSKVTAVGDDSVVYADAAGTHTLETQKVLVSIGRKPVTEGFGLEKLGVYCDKGAIVTDDHMRTNVDGVYASGDVNGISMLAHTAYRESEVAVNHMLGVKDRMDYSAIANVIYTNPEVACVGETLAGAAAKGIDAKCVTASMRLSGRYMAEVEGGNGIAKIVVNKKTNHLIGVHLIGSYASEMIFGAALMLETRFTPDRLKQLVFPHPTVGEVIREALFEI